MVDAVVTLEYILLYNFDQNPVCICICIVYKAKLNHIHHQFALSWKIMLQAKWISTQKMIEQKLVWLWIIVVEMMWN